MEDSNPGMRKQAQAWTVLAALALPGAARAQEGDVDSIPTARSTLEVPHDPFNLGVKDLAYAVGLKVAGVYDDNVLLTSANEEEDFITVLLLSGEALYKREGNEGRLSYRGRERLYSRNSELSGMEHFLDGSGTLRLSNFRLEAGFVWRAMKDTFDALEVREPVDSRFDREYVRAGADFNKFDVSFTVERAGFAVDDSLHDRGDYERIGFALLGAARLWPQAEAFVELLARSTDYREGLFSDFSFFRFALGARGSFSPKVRGEARLGWGRTRTDDEGILAEDDFSGIVVDATATWSVNERHEVSGGVVLEPAESVVSGLAIDHGVHAGWRFRMSERWLFRGSVRWSRETDSDGNGDRTGLQWRFGTRWDSGGRFYADAGILVRSADTGDAALDYDNVRFSIGMGVEW